MKTKGYSDRHCAQCGKLLIIRSPSTYTYKMRDYRKDSGTSTLFFCGWNCQEQYKASHPVEKRMVVK